MILKVLILRNNIDFLKQPDHLSVNYFFEKISFFRVIS